MVNLAGKLGSGAGSEDGMGTGHPGVKQGSPGHHLHFLQGLQSLRGKGASQRPE